MNVILNAADLNCRHLVFARDSSDIRPHAIFDFGDDPGLAILSAEGEMIMKGGISVSQREVLRFFNRRYATN